MCKLVFMTAELIAIMAVGLSLAGLLLRIGRRMDRLEDRMLATEQSLSDRIASVEQSLSDRIASVEQSLSARIAAVEQGVADLRERMARVEGLLEGVYGVSLAGQSPETV